MRLRACLAAAAALAMGGCSAIAGFNVTEVMSLAERVNGNGREFDIRTPAIAALKQSLATRLVLLRPHFDAGVLGLTHDGMIGITSNARLDVAARLVLARDVAEDNKDRRALYGEIARANGRPDWEDRMRSVFAERWIAQAPAGWYIGDKRGRWTQKPAPGASGTPAP